MIISCQADETTSVTSSPEIKSVKEVESKPSDDGKLKVDVDAETLLRQQLMAKQLIAKQQELLRLQQQRLEIELAKAKAQLNLQSKPIQHKARVRWLCMLTFPYT